MANQTVVRRTPAQPSPQKKAQIKRAVKLTVVQYRKTLELLAKT